MLHVARGIAALPRVCVAVVALSVASCGGGADKEAAPTGGESKPPSASPPAPSSAPPAAAASPTDSKPPSGDSAAADPANPGEGDKRSIADQRRDKLVVALKATYCAQAKDTGADILAIYKANGFDTPDAFNDAWETEAKKKPEWATESLAQLVPDICAAAPAQPK
jgi:hypothetical protein